MLAIQHYTFKASVGISMPSAPLSSQRGIIAVVHIIGPLSRDQWWYGIPTMELVRALSALQDDSRVSSIILDWNSPGGMVNSVPPMLDFLSCRRKKIYSSVEMAASAAYWLASATDGIYLQNDISARVGSIGAMNIFEDWKPFYEKNGIVVRDIYAPQSPDKNSTSRKAEKGDYSGFESELSYLADRFIDCVRTSRPAIPAEALTGNMYFAPDAIRLGLADEIIPLSALAERLEAVADLENSI